MDFTFKNLSVLYSYAKKNGTVDNYVELLLDIIYKLVDYDKDEIILKMAKAIQKIEHSDYHTWKSCSEYARIRALKQAAECLKIMEEKQ
jgi:hypothetical protein